MAQRKARADGSIGSHTKAFAKKLKLRKRYKVIIVDTKNKNRRVRSDAALGSIRKKATK